MSMSMSMEYGFCRFEPSCTFSFSYLLAFRRPRIEQYERLRYKYFLLRYYCYLTLHLFKDLITHFLMADY